MRENDTQNLSRVKCWLTNITQRIYNTNSDTTFEMIRNIIKRNSESADILSHSRMHNIVKTNSLHFKICDNGIGFTTKQTDGIGLTSMEQRALLLGGQYHIESTEDGTCISFTFPIKKQLL